MNKNSDNNNFLKTIIKLMLIFFFIASLVFMFILSNNRGAGYSRSLEIVFDSISVNIKGRDTRFVTTSVVFALNDPKDAYLFRQKTSDNPMGSYFEIKSEIVKILLDKDLMFLTKGSAGVKELSSEMKLRVNKILEKSKKSVIKNVFIPKLLIQ